ncbi:hypothetical protein [Lichenibacterium dinghuense]|uniref:hypothetical protein n=1 Tax=Lichenibacterium dinghuense TaxID=2895977 RepID=UPI001F36423B|nr:hypothetical protein [Lichenibacterium sp. 6Y81]
MIADPIVRMLMVADRVDEGELRSILTRARERVPPSEDLMDAPAPGASIEVSPNFSPLPLGWASFGAPFGCPSHA